mmetsp:Transcript_32683/g.64772  ORF Transcript_32683/g.64772 Transcript_32683/m.64772 type:complete len:325 (+) Transcript_32683:2190-3164(+)
MQETWLGCLPLVCRKENQVSTRTVHLVALSRVDCLLLDAFDLQSIKLLIEDLDNIHGNGLVDLLPKMGTENLDKRNLQRRNLPVHEYTRKVKLDLETDVNVCTVDGRGPPEGETAIRNLGKTRTLRVRKFLELHGLLKAACLLPEQSLPCGKVSTFEKRVFEDSFHAAQGLDHVSPVGIQVPKFSVVPLVGPPERINTQYLVLLEFSPNAPASVVSEGVAILGEKGVDSRYTSVPAVLKILKGEPSVLGVSLLPFKCILRPNALRVYKLALPRLKIPEKIWYELVLIMGEARSEVSDTSFCLLRILQVGLGYKNMSHGKHSKTT